MKKTAVTIIAALIFFSSQFTSHSEEHFERGLFVSVIQEPPVLSSRSDIAKLVDFAKKTRIDRLFVQVYYSNKAWFPSKIADPAPYHECVKSLSEDPMALLIKKSHEAGIEVHAWMNILSLGANKDAPLLKKYGTDILTRNVKDKKSLDDYKIDGQFFLEPGDPRVREELSGVVEEVLRAYPDLDGVQFDYIRYPDTEPAYGYTQINIARFKKALGVRVIDDSSVIWKQWKRDQVTELLGILASRARLMRPGIQVSATGCMPYSRASLEAYQDWPAWIERGLVDFVTLMSYSPYPPEFRLWLEKARAKTADFKKVNIGLGAYKLGRAPATFREEYRISEKSGSAGCVIFHYGSIVDSPALASFLDKRT